MLNISRLPLAPFCVDTLEPVRDIETDTLRLVY